MILSPSPHGGENYVGTKRLAVGQLLELGAQSVQAQEPEGLTFSDNPVYLGGVLAIAVQDTGLAYQLTYLFLANLGVCLLQIGFLLGLAGGLHLLPAPNVKRVKRLLEVLGQLGPLLHTPRLDRIVSVFGAGALLGEADVARVRLLLRGHRHQVAHVRVALWGELETEGSRLVVLGLRH